MPTLNNAVPAPKLYPKLDANEARRRSKAGQFSNAEFVALLDVTYQAILKACDAGEYSTRAVLKRTHLKLDQIELAVQHLQTRGYVAEVELSEPTRVVLLINWVME